jgi:hypothetical protein
MNANDTQPQVKVQGISNTAKAAQELFEQNNRAWVETDEDTFYHFLNVLPPIYGRGCFACSEPWTHNRRGEGVFIWLRNLGGGDKYEARYATIKEMV